MPRSVLSSPRAWPVLRRWWTTRNYADPKGFKAMFEQAIDKETGEAVLVKRPSSFRTSLHFAGAPHSALHASWLCAGVRARARARVCVCSGRRAWLFWC